MSLLGHMHARVVHRRRIAVLAERISALLPRGAKVLDVGCGDGMIDALIQRQRPDLVVSGIDVLVRSHAQIPVAPFDGRTIPYGTGSFDAVVLVDVLHHAESPDALLREAARVSRECLVLKDHIKEGVLADQTLRLMDWVGNARHGVTLPYHYWTEREWQAAFVRLDLTVQSWNGRIGLYPWPAAWLFERSLHFLARLHKRAPV
ncbi:MAG: class I SAM-dependent methyltransferase [Nitrospira sp.]|nr:class I SAM-dependent methyltransferase [Nitrospira sp.]